ncbi:MAG: OmpA family protein, partial [Paracoccaceae bacterium]
KAALPPAGTPLAPGRAMRIVFESTASKLPDTAKPRLKTLAAKLKGQPALRLQLKAYAGGESLSSGKARRLSLSRALSVRSYLIENGVRSTRIDVHALGNKTAEEPLNRVDVTVTKR